MKLFTEVDPNVITSNVSELVAALHAHPTDLPTPADKLAMLHASVTTNSSSAIHYLHRCGFDLNSPDEAGRTPLHSALLLGHAEVATTLACLGGCIDPSEKAPYAPGKVIREAVLRGDLDELRRRIDAGDSVDQAPQGGKARGWTALWLAVALGREDAARMLLEAGARCDTWTPLGQTPAIFATLHGHGGIVRLLWEHGARVLSLCLDKDNICPCQYNVRQVIAIAFNLLKAAGATVNGATATISPLVPSDVIRAIVPEDTPFWLAANNDAPMLAAELAGDLDPNMKTENGMTLLHWACAGDAPECVQLLLDAGAQPDAPVTITCNHYTPLYYCMHESVRCLTTLLPKCQINHVTNYLCPLHHALYLHLPAATATLAGAGAWLSERHGPQGTHMYTVWQIIAHMHDCPMTCIEALASTVGARLVRMSVCGMPALYYTVEHCPTSVVAALVGAGADPYERHSAGGRMYGNVLEWGRELQGRRAARKCCAQELPGTVMFLENMMNKRM